MNFKKYWSNNGKDSNSSNRLTIVLFGIYLVASFWILLFKLGVQFSYMENRKVNLIPFEPLISNGKIGLGEIIMNTIIFVPFGLYAGVLFKRWSFLKNLFFFSLTSLIVEGLQFILRVGTFDITDTITNTSGGVIGLMIFKAIEKVFKSSGRAQKSINIIAAAGTVLMILFLLLLKTGNLWIRYQ
jgi:glycopeptide antibiotics resistance protein